MPRASLQAALAERPLLFDGATGTYIERLLGPLGDEERNLLPLRSPGVLSRSHRAYLEAGADIIKTASFNANMIALGTTAEATKELNRAAARLARAAADLAATDGRARWVAGSVGPGSAAPSLGGPAYAELVASYLPQMQGLAEGGADLILIETAQDGIQIKAAIGAARLAAVRRGARLPFIVSATLDGAGRLLSGASAAAFAAIVEPFGPLAIGFNCSGGPEDLAKPFSLLADSASTGLIFMPNAGKPLRGPDGAVSWPLSAEAYADACLASAGRYGTAFWGGCCGTGPEHTAALRARIGGLGAPRAQRARRFALASAFEAYGLEQSAPFLVDERANASGSAAFKKLAASGDEEEALRFILERAALPVAAVDINLAGKNERALLPRLAERASAVAQAALSLDSVDAEALAAALPLIGGRPLVNSVNLEDRDRAQRLMDLASEHGAALVCLSLDGNGPARGSGEKLRIAGELYDLALSRGLAPCDLLFDLCTFPAAAGSAASEGSAYETLAALPGLAARCPGSIAILGVGNSSFGLPRGLRGGFTAAFLARARAAGLAAAIVDYASARLAIDPDAVQEKLARAAAPFFEPGPPPEGALEGLLGLAGGAHVALGAQGDAVGAGESGRVALSPLEAMADGIARAALALALQGLVAAIAGGSSRDELAAGIAAAMGELGRRYERGGLALPLVLRSADVARACFEALKARLPAAAGGGSAVRPLVVLSTVKGDLHDIGKNLVAMVLESAGYELLDLGTDKSADEIARAAADGRAVAIGVSGLLTRSLDEMETLAALLARQESPALLLCGGAAVDEAFVRERLETLRPGLVRYGKDPFAALDALRPFRAAPRSESIAVGLRAGYAGALFNREAADAEAPVSARLPADAFAPTAASAATAAGAAAAASAAAAAGEAASADTPVIGFAPPHADQLASSLFSADTAVALASLGQARLTSYPLEVLLARLDRPTLVQARLGYSRARRADGLALLDQALAALRERGGLQASCLSSWLRARKLAGDRLELRSETTGTPELFAFPREGSGLRRSVYDYYEDGSWAPSFCLTLGQDASAWLGQLRGKGDSGLYLAAHALLAGLAEAGAELAHEGIALELASQGLQSPGKRYSFGYPACPGVEANASLLRLLGASSIGLSANAEHQLVPEFSVSAIVVPNNGAQYFSPIARGNDHE